MEFKSIPTPAPTLARWVNLYRGAPGQSVLRALQYEAVGQTHITGQVLDYGGGQNARYLHLLGDADDIRSVNIDPNIHPTDLVTPGAPLPFAEDHFDHVICLNTLEHIYDSYGACQEIFRVLKPGGRAIISVPFIFKIHGHPDDFSRLTPSWWQTTCAQIGFSRLDFQPLIWGRHTTAGAILGSRGLFPRTRFHVRHLQDWLYAKVAVRSETYAGKRGARICAVSPGWFMIATK